MGKGSQHIVLGLAHRQAANGIAFKANLQKARQRLIPQVLEHAALNNAKKRVRRAFKGLAAASRPAQGHAHTLGGFFMGSRVRRAFIKDHGNVRVQDPLNAHGLLGR